MDLIKKELIYATMFGLHTKFIETENECKCGKIQVSPILPDTMERGKGADVRVADVNIKVSFECAIAPVPLAREAQVFHLNAR
jgi:hypothetical protein